MAQRIEHFTTTVPPNGESLDYVTFAGGDGTVTALAVYFPSGCVNKVGVQVFYAGIQVIPRTAGAYLRGNNEEHRFELESFPTGSSWSVFGTSTDRYQHKVRFDFEMDELSVNTSRRIGLPPVLFVPLDESLAGAVQSIDFEDFQVTGGGGLLGGGGGPLLSGPAIGSQAELDSLRAAIGAASSPQQAADMQARIDLLVAAGWV